ncbi:MAG: DUF1573 domain-containing protein [Phycisphaerales bacterium]|nr:DUF1573 domain-containing protein [Phycisphaerales bacterium]MCI0631566.1 DUF1573 domain-containing protein [Phycisphaerales bacterium]MCI0675198.1 DUF1573 domain-containing protein [Phycisphaerales bacterium]
MSGSKRKLILSVVAVGVALFVGLGWAYNHFLLQGPFVGETRHDFGRVRMDKATPIELHHIFHLTNRKSRSIDIRAIKPDCGCVTIGSAPKAVEPGQSFDLPVTLHFNMTSNHSQRTVLIHMDLGEVGFQTLRLRATSDFLPRLLPMNPGAIIEPDRPSRLPFILETYGKPTTPSAPRIELPDGLGAEFKGWTLNFESHDERLPHQWQGEFTLRKVGPTVVDNSTITITIEPAQPLPVPVFNAPPPAMAP